MKRVVCPKCDYQWDTRSKMYLTTCPRCGGKVRIAWPSNEVDSNDKKKGHKNPSSQS